jgi:tetratricopeptide (TPR) repeat protein
LISGVKTWYLIPPGALPEGSYPVYTEQIEWVELIKSNSLPDMLVFKQHPGEVVYIPEGWWHATFNEGFTLGLAGQVVEPLTPPRKSLYNAKFLSKQALLIAMQSTGTVSSYSPQRLVGASFKLFEDASTSADSHFAAEALNAAGLAAEEMGFLMNLTRVQTLQGAQRYYSASLTANEHMAEAHYNLGRVLKKQGALKQALEAYQHAIDLRPNHVDQALNMGNTWLALAQLETGNVGVDAESDLKEILNPPQSPSFVKATLSYQRALELDPKAINTLRAMAALHRERKNLAMAIEWIQKALAIDDGHFEALNDFGSMLAQDRRFTEAEAVLVKAGKVGAAQQKQSLVPFYNLAALYLQQERVDEAVDILVMAKSHIHLNEGAELLLQKARSLQKKKQEHQDFQQNGRGNEL